VERQGDNQDGDGDGRTLSVKEQFENQQGLDEITPNDSRVDGPNTSRADEGRADDETEANAEQQKRELEQQIADTKEDGSVSPTQTVIEITDPNLEPVGGKNKIKRGELWETDGDVEVVFPDGDRYVLFEDYDTKEYSDPRNEIQGFIPTDSKSDVIDQLKQNRERIVNEENGDRLQPEEQPFINDNGFSVIAEFIENEFAKGKSVSQDQLRKKYKKYNESQFNYLFGEDGLGSFVTESDWVFDAEELSYSQEHDFQEIVDAKQYLYQKTKGKVRGKPAISKVIHPRNTA
jgi:hypothetical protein